MFSEHPLPKNSHEAFLKCPPHTALPCTTNNLLGKQDIKHLSPSSKISFFSYIQTVILLSGLAKRVTLQARYEMMPKGKLGSSFHKGRHMYLSLRPAV